MDVPPFSMTRQVIENVSDPEIAFSDRVVEKVMNDFFNKLLAFETVFATKRQ